MVPFALVAFRDGLPPPRLGKGRGAAKVARAVTRWRALVLLGTVQFLMVLDTSMVHVSISRLVEDFYTEVAAIQAVITLYTLVMAEFMIAGGELGDMVGRRRMFGLSPAVYGTGSALSAIAPCCGSWPGDGR